MAQSISQESIAITGLPGTTSGARLVGGTASGAPVSGTFAVGDLSVDQTGKVYVCSVAGSPGTWVQIGLSTTNSVITAPLETFNSSGTTLSGSTAATLNIASSSFYNYTANPSASYAINITNAPTTTGQSATVTMLVANGATAYLPSNITINGTQAGADGASLPVQGATNNNITTYYQGGTAWTGADTSTIDTYTFVIMCTGSSTWTLLASQVNY